jgi:hypothetical protein
LKAEGGSLFGGSDLLSAKAGYSPSSGWVAATCDGAPRIGTNGQSAVTITMSRLAFADQMR